MENLLYYLDLFGVAVFAITGSLAAGRKKMDLLGVIVLALVTALGGGTLRDMILGATPVFWVSKPIYIFVASATAIVVFFLIRFYEIPRRILVFADAFGLAVFTVLGTEKALTMGTHAGIALVMGVMTGVVGGMMRDVLAGEIPMILRKEIYATAALCGAGTFYGLIVTSQDNILAVAASIIVTLGLRLSAIRWNLSLPLFTPHEEDSKSSKNLR